MDDMYKELAEMAKNGLVSFGFAADQISYSESVITSMRITGISLEPTQLNKEKPNDNT